MCTLLSLIKRVYHILRFIYLYQIQNEKNQVWACLFGVYARLSIVQSFQARVLNRLLYFDVSFCSFFMNKICNFSSKHSLYIRTISKRFSIEADYQNKIVWIGKSVQNK